MNDDKDADADVVVAVAMGFLGGKGRGRIVFGEYDGSTSIAGIILLIFVDLYLQ